MITVWNEILFVPRAVPLNTLLSVKENILINEAPEIH